MRLSVCLQVSVQLPLQRRSYVKLGIGHLYGNLSRNFEFRQNLSIISGTLHKDQRAFYSYCCRRPYILIYLLTYILTYVLSTWSRVLLENLTGFQLDKKFPHFMEPEGSLPESQEPYPEPARSSPNPHIPLPEHPS